MSWVFNGSINQKQTPAFYASSLATRPAFGFVGRIFIDTDIPSTGLYRDTGSAWESIADPGAGTTGTLQQVTTNGNSTAQGIAVSAKGIGIGTTIPNTNKIDIHSATGLQASLNGTTTTNAGLQLQNAGVAKWRVRNNYNSGANDFGVYDETSAIDRVKISAAGIIDLTGVVNTNSRVNIGGAVDSVTYALNVNGGKTLLGGDLYCFSRASIGNSNTTAATVYVQSNDGSIPVTRFQAFATENLLEGRNSSAVLTSALDPTGTLTLVNQLKVSGTGYIYSGFSIGSTNTSAASIYVQSNNSLIPVARFQASATEDILNGRNSVGALTTQITSGGNALFAGTLGINGVDNNVTFGDYTPTIVPITNLGAAGNTPFLGHWQQVGDIVTFSFTFNYANATAASQITCGITIPTGAAFTAGTDGWGAGTWSNFIVNTTGSCIVTARNGQAQIQLIWFQPALTTEGSITGVITYKKR